MRQLFLYTGMCSVEVYDIERDGSVSSVPALAGEIVTVFGPSTVYGASVEDGHHVASCEKSSLCYAMTITYVQTIL